MNSVNLERINALAKKSREVGLTEEEKSEQSELRAAYIAAYRNNLKQTLDNTYVVDAKGNKRKLGKR